MQGVLGGCADEKGDRTLCEVKMRCTCSNIQDPKAAPVPRELSERPNFQGPSIRRQPGYSLVKVETNTIRTSRILTSGASPVAGDRGRIHKSEVRGCAGRQERGGPGSTVRGPPS